MTEPLCVCGCGRPVPDQAYAAEACAYRAGDQLHDLADMTDAARDIATGVARHGSSGPQGAQDRIPLNLGATERLNAVQGELAGWARHVAETRGIEPPKPPPSQPPILGPLCRSRVGCLHESCKPIRDPGPPPADIITMAARFLAGHVEWCRHRPECDALMRDIETCHRIVRSIARGPNEMKFLGPCGATVILPDPDDYEVTCDGDVYAYRGARTGRCKTCGAQVDTSEREAWLDGEVRQHAFRAAEIANAYGVKVNTIRSWHARGQLANHGTDRDGRPLFNVGEVLDLAAADAARRATEQAKRARRAAAKAAESEDAA